MTSSPDSSRVARACALVLLASLVACAGAPAPLRGDARRVDDALAANPACARYVEALGVYGFGESGLASLEAANVRLGQSVSPAAHLVLARGWLDVSLYAELVGDDGLRQAVAVALEGLGVGGADVWDGLRGWFAKIAAEAAGADPEVAALAEQGAALAALLSGRDMTARYHAGLRAQAAPGAPFAQEARLARLLDVRDAVVGLRDLPLEERTSALIAALAPAVCPDGAALPAPDAPLPIPDLAAHIEAVCPLPCGEGLRPEIVQLSACGAEATGWPGEASADLYGPLLGVVARLGRLAFEDIAALHLDLTHPLVRAALPAVDALHAELARRPLALPVELDAADDQAGLTLPAAADSPADAVQGLLYLTLDADQVRLGVAPLVGLGAGGIALSEIEAHLHWPGRPLMGLGQAADGGAAEALGEGLRVALEEVAALLERRGLPPVEGSPLVIYAHRAVGLDALGAALDVAQDVLVGGRPLKLRLAVWGAGGLAFVELTRLPAGSWGRGDYQGLPDQARPLDLTLHVGADAVEVYAHGARVERLAHRSGRVDAEAVRGAVARLLAEAPGEDAIDIEGRGGDVGLLLEVVGAARRGGAAPVFILSASPPG